MAASRPLPLTGDTCSPWLWGACLAPGLLIPPLLLFLRPDDWDFALSIGLQVALYSIPLGLFLARPGYREMRRRVRRASLARALGKVCSSPSNG
jgi:hypothetical protein